MKSSLRINLGKVLLSSLLSILLSVHCGAQHLSFGSERVKVEAGLNFGPTFFLGDLGGNMGKGTRFIKDLNLELTKMMKGVFVAVYPSDWLGLRVAAQYTYVAGRDNIINTKGEDELWRKQRNLDFRSHVWEAYGAVEIYPTMLFKSYSDYDPTYRPYGFIGIGVFHFDPEGSITNQYGGKSWHKLHPLHTEGQGFPGYDKPNYSLTQINIPMGMGVRIKLSERVNISPELLYRKCFTDYIDDVSTTYADANDFDRYLSPEQAIIARQIHDKTVGIVTPGVNRYEPGTQRGNSHNMDAYFSCVLKLGIRFGAVDDYDGSSREKGRYRKQMRCPHFF
jgi:hypothetical protein